ncbi:uncharacterized protein LOC112507784 [Cynara cardunculus var. scolymus]|uniref:Seed maturation protein n=1 Tax=Cynara cardunculus var. scolymus TaxID=59895 RepID=A0A118K683_CYNCS|nr:uncharacterized protein LOC112507784 [Cynara cardunculus var. scolymus]KVI10230.1 hypothetical protein Ccrd_011340 [Cynara cardunculus var. scolymus]
MAKSKEDIKYGTAQAKLSEDESLRVAYKAGTPLEAGKIPDSDPDPIDLFSAAQNISNQQQNEGVIAESKPVDLFSGAGGVSNANQVDEVRVGSRQPSAN